jgi:hypothetical protein
MAQQQQSQSEPRSDVPPSKPAAKPAKPGAGGSRS